MHALLLLALAAQAPTNHAPFIQLNPKEVSVVVGSTVRFSASGSDSDGDETLIKVLALPEGARFEPLTGEVFWAPSAAQVGEHFVTFVVTDNIAETAATARVRVLARPPLRAHLNVRRKANVGERIVADVNIQGHGAGEAKVEFVAPPPGAQVSGRRLTWTPHRTGRVTLRARATLEGEELEVEQVVKVREEWISWALPGVSFALTAPLGSPELTSVGPRFEVAVVQWVRRNDNVGPSHGRVYAKADLLIPLEDPNAVGLLYGVGVGLSLERNPTRRFLIPYFAAEIGGLYHPSLGNIAQVTPQLGVHLFHGRNIFLTLVGGYLLPLSETEKFHGPTVALGGNFTLW